MLYYYYYDLQVASPPFRGRLIRAFFSSSLLLSSLELSDTKVYEPYIRARLGTAAHLCEVIVLKLRSDPGFPHSGLQRDFLVEIA